MSYQPRSAMDAKGEKKWSFQPFGKGFANICLVSFHHSGNVMFWPLEMRFATQEFQRVSPVFGQVLSDFKEGWNKKAPRASRYALVFANLGLITFPSWRYFCIIQHPFQDLICCSSRRNPSLMLFCWNIGCWKRFRQQLSRRKESHEFLVGGFNPLEKY